ncbi:MULTISPECIES: hypothetical protein [Microcoleaceae]|uniref:hypothetical protein n=1 Tax=Microcoleaceae TaxID=1892252 RepID=UPI00187E3244|nr:hypothetical protein [Tychonema sp. LEGE 06208]
MTTERTAAFPIPDSFGTEALSHATKYYTHPNRQRTLIIRGWNCRIFQKYNYIVNQPTLGFS